MEESTAARDVAERYLAEMLDAERERDFDAWCRRWHPSDLEGFTEARFAEDVDEMHRVLGEYRDREYLGSVRGRRDEPGDDAERPRFVWKVVYERNEALFEVGVRRVDGRWYAYRNACSL